MTWIPDEVFPPGSPAAVACGCTCDRIANNYGRGNGWLDGNGEKLWTLAPGCPHHCPKSSAAGVLPVDARKRQALEGEG